jgi:hypothetical protein
MPWRNIRLLWRAGFLDLLGEMHGRVRLPRRFYHSYDDPMPKWLLLPHGLSRRSALPSWKLLPRRFYSESEMPYTYIQLLCAADRHLCLQELSCWANLFRGRNRNPESVP